MAHQQVQAYRAMRSIHAPGIVYHHGDVIPRDVVDRWATKRSMLDAMFLEPIRSSMAPASEPEHAVDQPRVSVASDGKPGSVCHHCGRGGFTIKALQSHLRYAHKEISR